MMNEDKFKLENEIIKVEFNKKTGCINSIVNKKNGKDMLLFKRNTKLFRIVYALENYRGHHFDSSNQEIKKLKIFNKERGQVAILYYENLESSRGIFNVNIEIRAEINNASDELKMSIKVKNNDRGEVSQVWFPWVRGFMSIGDKRDEDVLAYPGMGGALIKNPMGYFAKKGEALGFHEWTRESSSTILGRAYPGRSSMQWMDLGCKSHGLYMACLNREGKFLVPRVQKHLWSEEEHLSLAMVKYPYIKNGESWESPEYILSPHSGDWHAGADKYRSWLNTWLVKKEKSKWARETNGFYHFILRHQDGTTINNIEDIPGIFEEAKSHGINLLFVCGWFKSGHDGNYPDYTPENPGELKKMFEKVQKAGGRILLYFNMRSYNMSNPGYKKEGYRWTVKNHDGVPATESWGWAIPHYPSYEKSCFASMCPGATGWQKKFLKEISRSYKLEADCALFDQLLVVDICHDKKHGHDSPESSFGPGSVKMLREALEKGKKKNPEFELSMEGVADIYTPYVAIFHSRVDLTDKSNPEVFRYTLPWVTGISGGFIDMGLTGKLYQSFILGLPLDIEIHTHSCGRISFDPDISEKIKRINGLRDKYKDIFVNGKFMDDVGLEVKDEGLLAKLIKSSEGAVLTLWNKNENPLGSKITIDSVKSGINPVSPEAYFNDGVSGERAIAIDVSKDNNEISIKVPVIGSNEIALIKIGGIRND